MKTTYLAFGWAIVALGVVHVSATPSRFADLNSSALWFASGGLALILTGALNLLNRAYGERAPGLRRVCAGANLVMTGFGALSGVVGHASAAQMVVVVGLLGGTAALSLTRGALRAPATAQGAP